LIGASGAIEGLGGEAELFDCAGVLNVVGAGFFEKFEIAGCAVHGIDEAVDGVALQEFESNGFVFAEIGLEFTRGGSDVGELEPLGEGEEGLLRRVEVDAVADDVAEGELLIGDVREEHVILGGEVGDGDGGSFVGVGHGAPKARHQAVGIKH